MGRGMRHRSQAWVLGAEQGPCGGRVVLCPMLGDRAADGAERLSRAPPEAACPWPSLTWCRVEF